MTASKKNEKDAHSFALGRSAWLLLSLTVAVIGTLWVAHLQVVWRLPFLNWFVHYGSATVAIALIVIPAARSFLANGQPSVLMLGCGVLMSEIGVMAMPMAFARNSDTAFAIYNTSVLASAFGHLAGVTIASRRRIRLDHPARWLTAIYSGGAAAMGLTIWSAFAGRMPVFFIDGQGGTPLRSLVVVDGNLNPSKSDVRVGRAA